MLTYETIETPIGTLCLIVTSGKSLAGIDFEHPKMKAGKAPAQIRQQLMDYFTGTLRKFEIPIEFQSGTAFEQEVWLALRDIPYGETRSYKWLAERIDRPNAGRAVGQALAKNPIPIVLPCHRIVENNGGIGGYSAGVDIKIRLLKIEFYNSAGKCDPLSNTSCSSE